MPREILYFDDYIYQNTGGVVFSPYFEDGQWYLAGDKITLEKMCEMINLDTVEMVMLRLRYGG